MSPWLSSTRAKANARFSSSATLHAGGATDIANYAKKIGTPGGKLDAVVLASWQRDFLSNIMQEDSEKGEKEAGTGALTNREALGPQLSSHHTF